jgi:UrcA family protein
MFNATKTATAALMLAVLAPIPAMAETVSVPVRYGDLDLSTAEGQRTFDRRIAAASRSICGAADLEREIARKALVKKCMAEVRQSAEPSRLAAIATKTRAVS